MRYIGLDLAWGQKNTTGAAVLEAIADDPAKGARLTHMRDDLLTNADICAFVDDHDDGNGLLVAIDAPTRVPNEIGRRPCEAILSRCMSRYQAGPHPANRTRLAGPDGTVRGEAIVTLLVTRKLTHTPYLDALPAPPRASFEVFPHPAHVALFGLSKTLKYKIKPGREPGARYAEFRRYAAFLEGLRDADPPLLLPPEPDFWLRRDPALLKAAALKRHEDALDAVTCAYVALYRHRWGDARCPVVGDLETGYIVTPATDEMRTCFTQAAEALSVGGIDTAGRTA